MLFMWVWASCALSDKCHSVRADAEYATLVVLSHLTPKLCHGTSTSAQHFPHNASKSTSDVCRPIPPILACLLCWPISYGDLARDRHPCTGTISHRHSSRS